MVGPLGGHLLIQFVNPLWGAAPLTWPQILLAAPQEGRDRNRPRCESRDAERISPQGREDVEEQEPHETQREGDVERARRVPEFKQLNSLWVLDPPLSRLAPASPEMSLGYEADQDSA